MISTKQDNELWYVQLVHNKVEIDMIPISRKSIYKQEYLFDTYEQAELCQKRLHSFYFETFQRRPYVTIDKLTNNLLEFSEIESSIIEGLKDFPQFDGIDFCDVCASGIQIRGHHKQIKGYCFGSQPTIKYDFSNYKECIEDFISMWKARDIPENLKQHQSFLDAGDRWGWD